MPLEEEASVVVDGVPRDGTVPVLPANVHVDRFVPLMTNLVDGTETSPTFRPAMRIKLDNEGIADINGPLR